MIPTPSELERLAILVEEAAEVQQIAMKIIRHGYGSYNPFDKERTSNRVLLEKEIGDLLFSIDLMIGYYDLNSNTIANYKDEKPSKIEQYLHENTAFKRPEKINQVI